MSTGQHEAPAEEAGGTSGDRLGVVGEARRGAGSGTLPVWGAEGQEEGGVER
jgi:hypothetical protein